MNKNELIREVSKQTTLSQKEARNALVTIASLIKNTLANGESVKFTGFGKFEVRQRAKRITYNPKTREKIVLPATTVPSFKVGKELKKAVSS